MTSAKIIAIVPAFNEAKTIGSVISELMTRVSEVVVVDDCSSDGTEHAARAAGAVVVRHDENLGYDQSLNSGFAEAARRGAQIMLTLDADGEHDPSDVPRIIEPILTNSADIVLGQRPCTRHWGESIFGWYTRLYYGIRDPLCGFKAYRRAVYDSIGFFDSLHSIGTELVIRAMKRGYRVALIPITLRQRADTSRFYAFSLRGNIRMLRALMRVLWI